MRGKNSWYLGVILIFSFEFVNADIRINEIMYDPDICDDGYCEWVELYNDNASSVDITGWKISDGDANDSLESSSGSNNIIIPGKSFAFIVDDDSRVFHNFNVGENTIWIYVDTTIGKYNLKEEETIILYNNG